MTEKRSESRQEHDANSADIKKLIMDTVDVKDKAVLLILLKISDDLFRNTQLTVALSDKFEKHVESFVKHAEEEMGLINQGRGFLRALVITIAVVQALVVYIVSDQLEEIKKMKEDIGSLKEYRVQHVEHHKIDYHLKK